VDTIYSFGYWVRRRRKALDLTQRQLAEAAGCALVTLKKIEADERRPSLEMAERLAGALHIARAERDAFLAAARGQRPVDTLGPPPQPALQRERDAIPNLGTPLIGREAELQTVLDLLHQPDTRLVSVVGPGGMGKTRLVLEAAAELRGRPSHSFPQGIIFIDLAAANTVPEMLSTVAVALGFEPDERPRDERAQIRQLAAYLRPRDCLLILDNLEQVADAALVLNEWLLQTPTARFLVTSRERLNLLGEQLLVLSGLPCPSTASPDPETYPSGRLFLARARRLRPSFVAREDEWGALVTVCRLVDGMPLALELAASWADTITPGEIAVELQRDLGLLSRDLIDLPPRHRSLDTVWSGTWARLDPSAQAVFARLCIFRGGFTRAAAEAVAGASLATLAQLTGRYLMTLDRGTGRYRIHELLRQYGLAQLGASTAAVEVREHHFEYYEQLLSRELTHLRGPDQLLTLTRLDAEQDNIRLALRWGLQSVEHADRLAHLIYDLNWYWRIRSRVREGRQWVEQALAQSGRTTEAEATLQFVAGHMAWMASDFVAARRHQETSLALLEDSRARSSAYRSLLPAYVTMALGMTEFHRARPAEALVWQRRSLAEFQALDDDWGAAFVMCQLGRVLQQMNDMPAAETTMAEALVRSHRLNDPFLLAIAYSNAAFMALAVDDIERATELARRATEFQRATGHTHSLGQTLLMLGRFAQRQGDEIAAHGYWAEALELFQDMGNQTFATEAAGLLTQD
jgi:predicted ATPase/DNA-binding XRE family transcriptional regulator